MKSRQQSGFTLIELVMVIVILGILAVVALPQFIDLRGDAQTGATQGVAGALGSASAINYAACQIPSAACVAIANCNELGPRLEGGLDGNFEIEDTEIAEGETAECTVNGQGTATATFIGHGTAGP